MRSCAIYIVPHISDTVVCVLVASFRCYLLTNRTFTSFSLITSITTALWLSIANWNYTAAWVCATTKRHDQHTPLTRFVCPPEFLTDCKPAGFPVFQSFDNFCKCILSVTTKSFVNTSEHTLWVTTRLDVAASNVLLFCRTMSPM